MKNTKKIVSALLALVMLLSMLVACTPDNSTTTTGTKGSVGNVIDPGDIGISTVPSVTQTPETPVVKNAGGLFFRPDNGGAGDAIPIYYDGQFYVFFLHSVTKKWSFVTTTDFVTYSDVTSLRDFGGTGDVLYVDGKWHLFAAKQEDGAEVIHHYVGDEITAMRDTYQNIYSDGEFYAMYAWRDPRVWWDETIGKYRMIVTTNIMDSDGVARNGGLAYLTSDDLYNWTIGGTYFKTDYYSGSTECPDTFKMGDWYYLVYSDCSFGKRTYYAKSKTPNGPWEIVDNDSLDSLFFYAGKTVSDGTNRYVIAWAGDRSAFDIGLNADGTMLDKDFATIQYAGNLVVHKLRQLENGDLAVEPVQAILDTFTTEVENEFAPLTGEWTVVDNNASVSVENKFATLLMQELPESFKLTFKLKVDARQAGIALNVKQSFSDRGYFFTFERQYNRIRQISGLLSGVAGYYFPWESELERPLTFDPDKVYDVTVVCDGQIAVIYIDDEIALTTRMVSFSELSLGLFCYDGSAEFTDIVMMQ